MPHSAILTVFSIQQRNGPWLTCTCHDPRKSTSKLPSMPQKRQLPPHVATAYSNMTFKQKQEALPFAKEAPDSNM